MFIGCVFPVVLIAQPSRAGYPDHCPRCLNLKTQQNKLILPLFWLNFKSLATTSPHAPEKSVELEAQKLLITALHKHIGLEFMNFPGILLRAVRACSPNSSNAASPAQYGPKTQCRPLAATK
jgi:hypothetical protein